MARLSDKPQRKRGGARLAKLAVLYHYGAKCSCCGVTNLDDLCLEHPAGDGAKHRAQLAGNGTRGGYKQYADVIRRGFPKGFSILCRSCNSSKGTGKYCKLHGKHKRAQEQLVEDIKRLVVIRDAIAAGEVLLN